MLLQPELMTVLLQKTMPPQQDLGMVLYQKMTVPQQQLDPEKDSAAPFEPQLKLQDWMGAEQLEASVEARYWDWVAPFVGLLWKWLGSDSGRPWHTFGLAMWVGVQVDAPPWAILWCSCRIVGGQERWPF